MVKMNNKCQKFGNSENMLFKIKTFNNSVMHFVAYKMKKRVGFFFYGTDVVRNIHCCSFNKADIFHEHENL